MMMNRCWSLFLRSHTYIAALAVLLSPKLLPLAKSAGLPLAMDLRGKFTGQPAVKIYDWARTTFFEKCSKHVIVWLGGACGDVIHPAVADWGVSQRAFFSDLVREIMRFRSDHREPSRKPEPQRCVQDTRPDVAAARAEYELAESLVRCHVDLRRPRG